MINIVKAFYTESPAINAFRGAFWYLVIDKRPYYVYSTRELKEEEKMHWERHKRQYLYWSKRTPFLSSFVHDPNSKDAFGGSPVTIRVREGGTKTFKGDLWSAGQSLVNPNCMSVGAATKKQLEKCYVFFGSYIDKDFFANWLDNNPDKVFKYERNAL